MYCRKELIEKMRKEEKWINFFLVLFITDPLACTPAPPADLSPGQCREDVDCPGSMICIHGSGAGSLGHCGCRSDLHCPSWVVAYEDAEGKRDERRQRSYNLVCDGETLTCGCAAGGICPGSLVCSEEGRCTCTTSEDCGEAGCTCQGGLCVKKRRDDRLLCDPSRAASPQQEQDAGVDSSDGEANDAQAP